MKPLSTQLITYPYCETFCGKPTENNNATSIIRMQIGKLWGTSHVMLV